MPEPIGLPPEPNGALADTTGLPPEPPEASPDQPESAEPPEAPESDLPPAPPVPVLPNIRSLIPTGLDLAQRTSTQLRGGSLLIAAQVLGLIGPPLLAFLILLARPDFVLFLDLQGRQLSNVETLLVLTVGISFFGVIFLNIESEIIATALLAGRAIGRPLSLREALRRSRQSFWRVFWATVLVQIPFSFISQLLPLDVRESQAASIVWLFVVAAATAPFAYAMTGIVLGDVGIFESLKRSIRLARARPWLAVIVSIFAALSQFLLIFGVGAGETVLEQIVRALGLTIESGGSASIWAIVIAILATAAIGSLVFTVAAISAAPQVVAFLGLTHYAAGLDKGRSQAGDGRGARWLTWPMAVGIALVILLSILAVSSST